MRTSTPLQGLYTNVAEVLPRQSTFLLSNASGLFTFGKAAKSLAHVDRIL